MAAACGLALIAFVGAPGPAGSRTAASIERGAPGSAVASSGQATPASGATRTIFPYSVIPGGVRTPEELARAIAGDPVVAAHYAGIDPARMRLVYLEAPRDSFVSYRIGSQVFWTSKKLHLRAGELVLTDGRVTVRARCGNQVAEIAQGPVSPAEPVEEAFDTPEAPVVAAAAPDTGVGFANTAPPVGMLPSVVDEARNGTPSPFTGMRLWPGPPSGYGTQETGSGSSDPNGHDSSSFDVPPTGGPRPPSNPPTDPGPDPTPDPKPPTDPGPHGPTPDPPPNPGPNPNPNPNPNPDPHPHPDPPRNPPPLNPPPPDDPNDPVPVPEPTTVVLVGIGAGSALVRHLRKRSRQR